MYFRPMPADAVAPDLIPPATDFVPLTTADGSRTLHSDALGEHYHSRFGAVAESRHVFLANGFRACRQEPLDLLEVGLGTGLNLLLTWVEAEALERSVRYVALEPFSLHLHTVEALDHAGAIGQPGRQEGFLQMMGSTSGTLVRPSPGFSFLKHAGLVQQLTDEAAYDLVYFDAFAPRVQPGMWTVEVFRALYRAMRPGALLVTYCAKGEVKRAMRAAGLDTELLPGPPGKRQMLRAHKP